MQAEDQTPSPKAQSKKTLHKHWDKEVRAAEKRTTKWRKQGNRVVRKYLDERMAEGDRAQVCESRLNLFNNHVSTLLSMLYGKMPKVDVSRRHADPEDDPSRVAGSILNRILNSDIERDSQFFSSTLKACLEDRLLPGMGVARVMYDVETEDVEVAAVIDQPTGTVLAESYSETRVVSEDANISYVHWQDFLWGYARSWHEVPWVAFRAFLTKDEAEKRFGKATAEKLEYQNRVPSGDKQESDFDRDMQDPNQRAEIFEIWDKGTKEVYWFSKGCERILDTKPDPLGLSNFFPCPMPMAANITTTLYQPKPDYVLAQDLYSEIDILQTRISMITKAVKVVGVYDKQSEGVKRMMVEGFENDLIPVDNWAMFAEKGGLQGQIDWLPLQEVVSTLGQLREIRDETISLLYQVTGLSEVMRGVSSGGQPESATANALKARFSSVRVQYLQDEFARFASDLQALKAEVIGRHFEPETIIKQSNIAVTPDRELIPAAIGLIKKPDAAVWHIEIRPESIAMIDYAQLKSERTEYLTALATFLQSGQAMLKAAPQTGPMMLELMKWGLAGFKGSAEIEGIVDRAIRQAQEAMKNPPPEKPDPKIQQEQMKFQLEMQKMQTKANQEMQKLSAELKADLAKERAKLETDIISEREQARFNMLEKQMEARLKMMVDAAKPKSTK